MSGTSSGRSGHHSAAYLHCPRCRLTLRSHSGNLLLCSCPRCRGRSGVTVPLFRSPLSGAQLHADREARA